MNNFLSPHDRFFRSAMANPKVAREFFEQYLPLNIKSVLNFDAIKLKKDSFIDDKLKQQICDLLFAAEFNNRSGYLYLLVEHQSSPQKLMPLRVLKYMLAIIDHHLTTTKSERLPVIYPMIFYNGKKKYNYSTDIFDLFDEDRDLAQSILLKPYQLIDTNKLSDEELKRFLYSGMLARLMKHIFEEDFLPIFENVAIDLRYLENKGEFGYIYTIFSYIFEAGRINDLNKFRKVVRAELPMINEEKIMTLAEICRQEGKQLGLKEGLQKGLQDGKQQGLQEGLQKGKHDALQSIMVAIELIKQNFSIKEIARSTNLSVAEIEKIKKKIN